ncbi:MAG TPA: hypothetical protein H9684_10090 [Firmicutes bacterium]|nr:hypothetical protein [Bacillota bacterium]
MERNGKGWKEAGGSRREQEGYRREQKGAEEGGEKGKERRFSVHFERKRGIMEISTNFFKKTGLKNWDNPCNFEKQPL